MAKLHVLRIFTGEDGEWGNPLAVFLSGSEIPAARRQEVASELGFSETVYVDDLAIGRIQINTPARELGFAGHPTVGTAWLLARAGSPVEALHPPAGEVGVRHEGAATFVEADPAWNPVDEFVELASPSDVRALRGSPRGALDAFAWAWIDEDAGTIRARCFVPELGVAEDEATGSAVLALAARLGREIVVHQGRGSVLVARPTADGRAEVGGLVQLDEVRAYELAGT